MSTTTAISEAAEPHDGASPRPVVPFKSPTYPPRVHFRERGELEQQLPRSTSGSRPPVGSWT